MKIVLRFLVLAIILAAAAAGARLALRSTAPERRDLDAVVTVGSDVVHDVTHPALDLTRLSTAEEIRLGQAIDAQTRATRMGVGGDRIAEAYLNRVVQLVAAGADRRDIPYVVALERSTEINACAVAGGRLYVTEGMLSFVKNEAELAAVLGHEIAHVDLRHCVRQLQIEQAARRIAPDLAALAGLGYELMERGFSEEQELAADGRGAVLSAMAGYDPWQVNELLSRLLREETKKTRPPSRDPIVIAAGAVPQALERYFRTHPPADQRMESVRRALMASKDLWMGRPRTIGRANLAERRTQAEDPRPGERIERARAPEAP